MSDRHPKWQRVEPGTIIPAGQPYMIEYDSAANYMTRCEYVRPDETQAGFWFQLGGTWELAVGTTGWFVDSSWTPPLLLPTTPTWGIAVHAKNGVIVGRFWMDGDEVWHDLNSSRSSYRAHSVLEFTPLTNDQIAQIEAAR